MFSPEGRVYQVEYALQSIEHAGAAIGLITTEGIVFAAQKRLLSPLLDTLKVPKDTLSGEKMFILDAHLAVVVAGITSDSYLLIEYARQIAQRYRYTYHECIPVDIIAQRVADFKQRYTQYGGLRPFGVSFLLAGYDQVDGYQLYCTEPSGNYTAWKAHAIGNGCLTAQNTLRTDWSENMTLQQGIQLALKVISRVLDLNVLNHEKVELSLFRFTQPENDASFFRMVQRKELEEYLTEFKRLRKAENEVKRKGEV